jgi:hypothetical protein
MKIVGDSPRGPLKQWGEPHLKPTTKPKHVKPNHEGNSPQGLGRPIEAAHLEIPSNRLRLVRGCVLPSGGLRPVRGAALPSSRFRLARGYAPPSAGVRHARGRPSRVRRPPYTAFNALTLAGRRHHAPGARTPVPPH